MMRRKNTVDLLTLATLSHLPQAVVAAKSARDTHYFSSIYIFVVDLPIQTKTSVQDAIGEEHSWLYLICPDDLSEVLQEKFLSVYSYFDPFETCCFAKYIGISHIVNELSSSDACAFVDADMLFTASPDDLLYELSDKALLITPHQFSPSNASDEYEYLQYGWINAGFFVVNRRSPHLNSILDWLIERIETLGFVAPSIGLFCDQKWISLAPSLFPNQVVVSWREGLNVAYWNLHERNVWSDGETLMVNDERLIMFHFSGFVGAKKGALSKHWDGGIEKGSPLERLCQQYQQQLTCFDVKHKMPMVDTLPFVRKTLKERLAACSNIRGVEFKNPQELGGFFSRVGRKLDNFISQILPKRT